MAAGPARLASLPPRQARLCLRVEAFLRSLVPEGLAGRPLILALSGGLDSTALAIILGALSARLETTVIAAHMDHCLREASAQDAQACEDFCRRVGLEFTTCRRDVAALASDWGAGIEDAGRRARHGWLEEVRAAKNAFAVVMAHHLDDLAEDQIMRLTRGTGWPALGGMPARDAGRRLLRPLLLTPKAELRELLDATGTPWREDESNQDPAFTRNRVRRDLLPLLVRENPDYLQAAAELWRQARIDQEHWEEAVSREALQPLAQGGLLVPRATLEGASKALRLRLFKRAVEALGPGQPLSQALHGLDQAWTTRSTGKRFQFPGNKEARVERGGVSFHLLQPASGVDTFPPEG